MNKNNTKEIFNTWKNFLEQEKSLNYNSNLLNENLNNNNKLNKNKVKQLIEWGDSLENLINENIDIKLLESHYLNENLIGKWKKWKDKVKSFFTQGFTKDKKDEEGNLVRTDPNDEESLAVKEYTSLTKTIHTGLLIAMLTSTFFGAVGMSKEEVQTNLPEIVSIDTGNAGNEMDLQTAKSLTDLAVNETGEAEKLVKELEVSNPKPPSVQYLNFAPRIISIIKQEKGEKGLKSLLKKVKPRPEALGTADDAKEFELGLTARVLELSAKELGLDTDGAYDFAEYSSEVTQDLSKANNAIKKYISSVDINAFVNSGPELRKQYDNFNEADYKNKIEALSEDSMKKLIEVARIYTIKKVYERNRDIFDKASKIKLKRSGFEGGDAKKDVSQEDLSYEASSSAKLLSALYNSCDKFIKEFKKEKIKDVNSITSDLKKYMQDMELEGLDGGGKAGVAIDSFSYFIVLNITGHDTSDLENKLESLELKDIKSLVNSLSSFHIKSKKEEVDQEK